MEGLEKKNGWQGKCMRKKLVRAYIESASRLVSIAEEVRRAEIAVLFVK
jgi:hypothetical protein